jgi:hypothetical protein
MGYASNSVFGDVIESRGNFVSAKNKTLHQFSPPRYCDGLQAKYLDCILKYRIPPRLSVLSFTGFVKSFTGLARSRSCPGTTGWAQRPSG